MTASWDELSRRLDLPYAREFAARELEPILRFAPTEAKDAKGKFKHASALPLQFAGVMFIFAFFGFNSIFPHGVVGEIMRFVFFPLAFFATIGFSIFLFRHQIGDFLLRGQARYLARAKAMAAIAARLGLRYSPAPAGAPLGLKIIGRQSWAPAKLREAVVMLESNKSLTHEVDVSVKSGLFPPTIHAGAKSEKTKALLEEGQAVEVEDGFEGVVAGVRFAAFERVETVEDAPNVHHLTLVFMLPRRLYGVTHLRAKGAPWPAVLDGRLFSSVGVAAPEFQDRFEIRASDQVEARTVFDPAVLERLARLDCGKTARAVAYEDHLVVDVAGEDRFAIIDLKTGEWSEETMRRSLENVADMLDLAAAIAGAFGLGGRTKWPEAQKAALPPRKEASLLP